MEIQAVNKAKGRLPDMPETNITKRCKKGMITLRKLHSARGIILHPHSWNADGFEFHKN